MTDLYADLAAILTTAHPDLIVWPLGATQGPLPALVLARQPFEVESRYLTAVIDVQVVVTSSNPEAWAHRLDLEYVPAVFRTLHRSPYRLDGRVDFNSSTFDTTPVTRRVFTVRRPTELLC